MGQAAFATLEAAGDDWGAATSGLIRAIGAARAGDIATVASMARAVRRHSDAIDYDAFRVPGLLLEAWVAERRRRRCGRGGRIPARARARRAHRVRRPRCIRALCARFERARERRPARGRGAPAPGARDRRCGRRDVGRGPRASPARARRRGDRRRGHRREAVSPGARVVAVATGAPGAREPFRRTRRQPRQGGAARACRDRGGPRRHGCGRRAPRTRRARPRI